MAIEGLNVNSLTVDANGRVSFSGLGSGIDFRDTVDKIIAARRIPVDTLETRVSENTTKITALDQLKTSLTTLRDSLAKLYGAVTLGNSSNIFEGKSAFASTSRLDGATASPAGNLVGVSVTNAAAASSHEIELLRTAKAHKISSNPYTSSSTALGFSNGDKFSIAIDDPRSSFESGLAASGSTALGSSGTLSFTDANGNSIGAIAYSATDTLDDLASAITSGISGVSASVVTTSSGEVRLRLNSPDKFKFTETGAGSVMTDFDLGKRTLSVTSTTTLADLRDLINSANSGASATGVTASIVTVGASENYLVLTKDQTGYAMTLEEVSGTPLQDVGILNGSGGIANQLQAAQTARFYADGLLDQTNTIYESGFQTSASAQMGSAGTLQFTRDSDGAVIGTVNYASTDTLQDLVDSINANVTGATATIVTDGNGVRMEISGAAAFSFAETGAGTAIDDLAIDNKRRVIERTSNTISDLFNGVTLTLFQAEKGTTIQLDVERDLSQVKDEIVKFVNAYNELRIFLNSQKLTAEEITDEDSLDGVLRNSSALNEVTSALGQILGSGTAGVDSSFSVLAQIGIDFVALNQEDPLLRETLEIDESRLDEVLLNNPNDVRRLFSFDFSSSDPRVRLLGFTGDTTYDSAGYTLNIQPGGGENLLTYSEEADNAAWSKTNATISADALAAPDGSMTADGLVADATSASHSYSNATPVSVTAGETYVFSTYVKAGDKDTVRLSMSNTGFGSDAVADFDLTAGTVTGTGIGADDATIEAVGDGWYRVSVSATAVATGDGTFELSATDAGNPTYAGDGSTVDAYFWGTQVDTATTNTSVLGDGDVTATRATVNANVDTAPNGAATADGLVGSTDNDTHFIANTDPLSVSAGERYDFVTFVKAGAQPKVQLALSGGTFAAGTTAEFDVSTGTLVGTGAGADSAAIEDVGGGWYKVTLSATAASSGSAQTELYSMNAASGTTFTGDGSTVDTYFWDMKLVETGAQDPGVYIATTDAASSGGTANVGGDPNGAGDGTATVSGSTIQVQEGAAKGLRLFFDGLTQPESVQIDFTIGIGAQMYFAIEKLLASKTGVVATEKATLTDQNTFNEDRISEMLSRLEVQRQSLLERYLAMETALATAERIMDSIKQTTQALFGGDS